LLVNEGVVGLGVIFFEEGRNGKTMSEAVGKYIHQVGLAGNFVATLPNCCS
jgi:hypothetical protein